MPASFPPPLPLDVAVHALVEAPVRVAPDDDGTRPRQCGRCRLLFEGDPSLHPAAMPDYWLCPPCRTILLGGRRDRA